MPDIEKVIKGLKYLHDKDTWREGIMIHDDHARVRKQITEDALELLKEQDNLLRKKQKDIDKLQADYAELNPKVHSKS